MGGNRCRWNRRGTLISSARAYRSGLLRQSASRWRYTGPCSSGCNKSQEPRVDSEEPDSWPLDSSWSPSELVLLVPSPVLEPPFKAAGGADTVQASCVPREFSICQWSGTFVVVWNESRVFEPEALTSVQSRPKGLPRHGQRKSQDSAGSEKWPTNNEALREKLNKRKCEWFTAELRATTLESNVVDFQGRLNQALKQLKDAENKWDVLSKRLERVKKEMQDQILRCRGLSDRAKTLNEQLDFQKFLYEKELEKLWRNQEKMQSIYEAKMRELQELLDRRSSDFSVTCDELPSYKTRLGGVKSHIAELESLNQSLQSCVRDLEPLEVVERSVVRVDTVLSYCRGTLFDDSLADYLPFFQENSLGVANAAPLGMGLLTSSTPPIWHPAAEELKKTCAEAAIFCQEAGCSIERLGLQYSLTKFHGVHTTIVGMNSRQVLQKNVSCLGGVTKEEEKLGQEVKSKFFNKPTRNHWEGVEIYKIRRKLAKRRCDFGRQISADETCHLTE
ncbi:hypothetical protein MRX96_000782 [Rhipicephalus microplus]